jgi:predicted phage-related endonuclease
MAIQIERKVQQVTVYERKMSVTKNAVELTEAEAEMLEDFLATRDMETKARKKKEALAEQLKEIIGEADVALVSGEVRVELIRYTIDRADMELLRAEFPDVAETVTKTTNAVRLQAK